MSKFLENISIPNFLLFLFSAAALVILYQYLCTKVSFSAELVFMGLHEYGPEEYASFEEVYEVVLMGNRRGVVEGLDFLMKKGKVERIETSPGVYAYRVKPSERKEPRVVRQQYN